ncbi:MAG: aminotransferase class I/II-fold pyridoxal phosphate-dependent enzyme [Pseudomonadota bacterium]|jgi:aspartate/methionine/tyrosine aminotransferase|nr:aminotransferase class I/II-fold pyridoxal phosphate-dependent enzyme [Alphaproteobacteria bacterium]
MNNPNIFKLEEYLGQYEFKAPYLLCCSDAESITMQEMIDMGSSSSKDAWNKLSLGYTEVSGLPLLREQITQSFYPKLSANNILCFSGAEEGIFCALYTLCDPDDHVIVLTPCYQSLAEIPALKGALISHISLREENYWRIDLQEIQNAIKPNTKCIVINFPHNPTGQVITKNELQDLVDVCRAHNLWLFSDEVYRLLGNPSEGWAPSAVELYEKALSLNVMSKAFGLAGLRVGWIACQNNDLLKKIEQMKHYTSICNSAPSEILSLIALENKDKILARNNQIVDKNLQLLDSFMDQYRELFSWVRPQGGCVGFVRYKKEESIDNFSKRLVDDKGVLLMPASIYSHSSNHFRIGFGRKNMPESLEKLKEFLQD